MISKFGKLPLSVVGLLLCLSLIAGLIWDYKWIIVALMIFFLLLPMLMAFLYYWYGLNSNCYFNITLHTIKIGESDVCVEMYFPIEKVSGTEANGDAETIEHKEIEYRTIRHTLSNKFGRFTVENDSIILPIHDRNNKGFLWLPKDAFESEREYIEAVKLLTGNIA